MKTIIVGYADASGQGASEIVCDANVSAADQSIVIAEAKQRHKFPKGVRRLEMVKIEPVECAIFISSNIGEQLEVAAKAKAVKDKAEAERVAKADTSNAKFDAAIVAVSETAQVRNELMGKLHQAEAAVRNLELTPEPLRAANYKDALAKAARVIVGEPGKVAGLKEQVVKAIADYDVAAKKLADIREATNKPESKGNKYTP